MVTAGGTTSWDDLAIRIISRHCSPGEALRIANVYLLKWHGEGQLPMPASCVVSPMPLRRPSRRELVDFENPAFFRRLFERCTGLMPGQYRRMFRPFAAALDVPAPAGPAAASE
jgi:transcriptional regulator GlxA family with amidase domain